MAGLVGGDEQDDGEEAGDSTEHEDSDPTGKTLAPPPG
jgi:hypothetical protein